MQLNQSNLNNAIGKLKKQQQTKKTPKTQNTEMNKPESCQLWYVTPFSKTLLRNSFIGAM